MTILGFFLMILLFGILILIGLLLYLYRLDIAILFHPERFTEINIVQLDDVIHRTIFKKEDDLRYEFNGTKYNLFYTDSININDDNSMINRVKNTFNNKKSSIFRVGKISSFTFIEGQEDPIDFRDLKKSYSQNSTIKREMTKVELSKLVSSVNDFGGFIDKYKILIIIVIVILILILLFRQPKVVIDASMIQGLK